MLDGNTEDRPTIRESYASAISTGNTRLQPHRTTQADLIAAAGMNPNRMGMALMRLSSEWNSGAVPKPTNAPDVKELARQIAEHRFREWVQSQPPMTRERIEELHAQNAIHSEDMRLAHEEARVLAARSVDWNLEENKLRFQRLKTLGTVRAGLAYWVHEKGWEGGEHLVAAVLRHYLSPNCPACNGSGLQMVPGTLGREAKKRCRKCENNEVRGKRNVPHGGRGKRLLDHMQTCVTTAARDLRQGAYRLHRDELSELEREDQRSEENASKARRAATEAARDEKSNPAALAKIAERSMGRRPVVVRLIRQIAEYRLAHANEKPLQLAVTRADLVELAHAQAPSDYGAFVNLADDPPVGSFMGVRLVMEGG